MTALARKFPMFSLVDGPKRDAPGIEPFDAELLTQAARAWSSGEMSVVRFLIFIFSGEHTEELGPFSLHQVANMDAGNRAVIMRWVANPWFQ